MADSRREGAVQNFVTALNTGAEKPAELSYERWRLRPVRREELPAAGVHLVRQTSRIVATRLGKLQVDSILVAVEIRLEGENGDVAMDRYLVYTQKAALADRTLGGLADNVELKSIDWGGKADRTDATYTVTLSQYQIDVPSSVTDPTTL